VKAERSVGTVFCFCPRRTINRRSSDLFQIGSSLYTFLLPFSYVVYKILNCGSLIILGFILIQQCNSDSNLILSCEYLLKSDIDNTLDGVIRE